LAADFSIHGSRFSRDLKKNGIFHFSQILFCGSVIRAAKVGKIMLVPSALIQPCLKPGRPRGISRPARFLR
jgi:hypothetical protein